MKTPNRRRIEFSKPFPNFERLEPRCLMAGLPSLIDLRLGAPSSAPKEFCNVNGTTFFVANNGTSGAELWKSDGTIAGTVLVKDIRTGSASSVSRYLTNVNGTLFFSATNGTNGYELWTSNGTTTGTVMVKDIQSGSLGSVPKWLTNVRGAVGEIPSAAGGDSDCCGAGSVVFIQKFMPFYVWC